MYGWFIAWAVTSIAAWFMFIHIVRWTDDLHLGGLILFSILACLPAVGFIASVLVLCVETSKTWKINPVIFRKYQD